MDDSEATQQQRIHEVLEDVLRDTGSLDEGNILAGWLVSWESASLSSAKASSGHFYGPREMTTWRAMGLNEWTRHTLIPDEDDD